MKKKSIGFRVLAALVGLATFMVSAPAGADVWRPAVLPGGAEQASLTLDDGWRFFGSTSSITQLDTTHTVYGEACESWSGVCEIKEGFNAVANLILPVCETQEQAYCLESFSIGLTSSPLVEAKPIRQVAGYTIAANPNNGLPKGSLPAIWEAQLPNASGSKTYVVNPRVIASVRNGKVTLDDFQVSVWPISDRVSSGKVPVYFKPADAQRKASVEGMWDVQCAVVDTNYCGQIEDFSPGTKLQVSVRIPNQVTGWLKGRLTNPEISSTPFGQNSNRFVIAGEPVTVPKLGARVSSTDPDFTSADGRTTITSGSGLYHALRADSPTGIKFVKKLVDATKDTAAAIESLWYVGSLANSPDLARCTPQAGQFVGLVTTNAMAFDGGVPKYQSGYFSYNLAGLHYGPDGKTENLGTYDLAIQSDVARCLYGFSKAPVSATITVVGSGGEQKVAVTQVTEKAGWLTLSAKGFTFSENQVRVQIRQARTFSIAKFAGSATKLSKAQTAAISNVTTSFGPAESATCTVFYKAAKDRRLAQQRAASVCSLVQKQGRPGSVTALAALTATTSSVGRITIQLK